MSRKSHSTATLTSLMAALYKTICSGIKRNSDLEEILEFPSQGHNLAITGQDGVGKNEVVKQIVQCFKARAHGKTVGVICSSGIACQVYDHGSVLTFHFFSYHSINSGATLA